MAQCLKAQKKTDNIIISEAKSGKQTETNTMDDLLKTITPMCVGENTGQQPGLSHVTFGKHDEGTATINSDEKCQSVENLPTKELRIELEQKQNLQIIEKKRFRSLTEPYVMCCDSDSQ